MVFKFIKDAFARKETASAPTEAWRGIVTAGPKDSTMEITQLELLRDAVLRYGPRLRVVAIGTPFARLERTLAGAGFDTAADLHTLGAARRVHTFEHRETGTVWTLAESELDRATKPELRLGKPVELADAYVYLDWVADPKTGIMRHRATGREVARPARAIYTGMTDSTTTGSYDGIHGGISPIECFERLRDFGKLGLNAQLFVRQILTLLGHTRGDHTSAQFIELTLNEESLQTEIEYLAAHWENLPKHDHESAQQLVEQLMQVIDNVPPMARQLATELRDELTRKSLPYTLDDFLIPGKVWHLPTDTHAQRHFAKWVKPDLQRRLLAEPAGDEVTLILCNQWHEVVAADLDVACLERPDILQYYGIPRPDSFEEAARESAIPLLRAFPLRLWHATSREMDNDLLLKLHPIEGYTDRTLAFLNWEKRLVDATGEDNREADIALNVDGIESTERARRASLRR